MSARVKCEILAASTCFPLRLRQRTCGGCTLMMGRATNGKSRRRVETSATASHNGRDTQPATNVATGSNKVLGERQAGVRFTHIGGASSRSRTLFRQSISACRNNLQPISRTRQNKFGWSIFDIRSGLIGRGCTPRIGRLTMALSFRFPGPSFRTLTRCCGPVTSRRKHIIFPG
jgi:hypothetical protein